MKYVLIILLLVGCNSPEKNNDDKYELIYDAEFHSHDGKIEYFNFMLNDQYGLCMYQKRDSPIVVIDSMRAIKVSLSLYLSNSEELKAMRQQLQKCQSAKTPLYQ